MTKAHWTGSSGRPSAHGHGPEGADGDPEREDREAEDQRRPPRSPEDRGTLADAGDDRAQPPTEPAIQEARAEHDDPDDDRRPRSDDGHRGEHGRRSGELASRRHHDPRDQDDHEDRERIGYPLDHDGPEGRQRRDPERAARQVGARRVAEARRQHGVGEVADREIGEC